MQEKANQSGLIDCASNSQLKWIDLDLYYPEQGVRSMRTDSCSSVDGPLMISEACHFQFSTTFDHILDPSETQACINIY